MNIPDDVIKSFENLVTDLIEQSGGPFYELCFSKKHSEDIYISAPFFLVEAYQNYLLRKNGKPEADSDYRFMGIKMIPSSDYAITLFHKNYIIYKEDWMIRKIALMPGMEAYVKEPDSGFKTIIKPFIPGEDVSSDPSLN